MEQIQPHRINNIRPLPPIEPHPIDPPVVVPTPEPVDPTPTTTPVVSVFDTIQVDPNFFNVVGSANFLPVEPKYDEDKDDDHYDDGDKQGRSRNSGSDKFFLADSDLAR